MILVCMLVCAVLSRHTEIHNKCKILITSCWVFGWMVCFISPTAIFFLMKPFLVCFHLTAMFWSNVGRYCLQPDMSCFCLKLVLNLEKRRMNSLLLLTLISSIITKIFKSCFHLMILRTFEVIWRLLRWWWPDLRCLSFEVHNISLDLLHCAVCIMVHVSDGYMGILSNEIYFPGSINNKECFLFRSCFLKKLINSCV